MSNSISDSNPSSQECLAAADSAIREIKEDLPHIHDTLRAQLPKGTPYDEFKIPYAQETIKYLDEKLATLANPYARRFILKQKGEAFLALDRPDRYAQCIDEALNTPVSNSLEFYNYCHQKANAVIREKLNPGGDEINLSNITHECLEDLSLEDRLVIHSAKDQVHTAANLTTSELKINSCYNLIKAGKLKEAEIFLNGSKHVKFSDQTKTFLRDLIKINQEQNKTVKFPATRMQAGPPRTPDTYARA